jgi:hypothetical protein
MGLGEDAELVVPAASIPQTRVDEDDGRSLSRDVELQAAAVHLDDAGL